MTSLANQENRIKTENSKTVAEDWLKIGVNPIPLYKGTKKPHGEWKHWQNNKVKQSNIDEWFKDPDQYDVGIITGSISHLSVIDIDVAKGNKKSGLDSINELGITLPNNSLIAQSPSGGTHVFVNYDWRLETTVGVLEGVDIRSDRAYVKVYGNTVNEDKGSSNNWKIINGRINRNYFPTYFNYAFAKSSKKKEAVGVSNSNIIHSSNQSNLEILSELKGAFKDVKEGERNDSLFTASSIMRRKGIVEYLAKEYALELNSGMDDPLSESEVRRTVESAYSYSNKLDKDEPIIDENGMLKIDLVPLSEVQHKRVEWLWDKWFPKGKIIIVAGVEGTGKTFALLDIAGRIASGKKFPISNQKTEGKIIYFTFEDGIEDTMKERVQMLGYNDCQHNLILHKWDTQKTVLSLDTPFLNTLEFEIQKHNAKMVFIDPLSGLLPDTNDSKETAVRPKLQGLGKVAQRTGCTIVLVKHFSKRTEMISPTHAVSGSIAYSGVVRAMHYMDKIEDGWVGLFTAKNNLSTFADPIEFRVSNYGMEWREGNSEYDYVGELMNRHRKKHSKSDEVVEAIMNILTIEGELMNEALKEKLKDKPYEFSENAIRDGKSQALADELIDYDVLSSGHKKYYINNEGDF